MAQKVNASHGPSTLVLTGSLAATELGKWIKFGPIKGNFLGGRAVFSGTSAGEIVNLQGIMAGSTMPSTSLAIGGVGVVDLITFLSSLPAAKLSTEAGIYSYLRLASSAFMATGSTVSAPTVTVHFGAQS